MVLDGYGLNDRTEGNAIALANTPVMDRLMKECPFVKGQASGLAVGLPDGQMGNSEVGHMNIGAGRIIYQDLTRITKAIQTILRREAYPHPYEALKALTRTNQAITESSIKEFIEGLNVSEDIKKELRAITPHTYTGL